MTEQANLHTEALKAAFEAENPDFDQTETPTTNDVDLADYPGKAEKLAEGQQARKEFREWQDEQELGTGRKKSATEPHRTSPASEQRPPSIKAPEKH